MFSSKIGQGDALLPGKLGYWNKYEGIAPLTLMIGHDSKEINTIRRIPVCEFSVTPSHTKWENMSYNIQIDNIDTPKGIVRTDDNGRWLRRRGAYVQLMVNGKTCLPHPLMEEPPRGWLTQRPTRITSKGQSKVWSWSLKGRKKPLQWVTLIQCV